MADYLPITPQTEDYLRASELFNNLTYNTEGVGNYFSNIVAPVADAPFFIALNGFGFAYMQGEYTVITATPSANMDLFTLPTNIVPARDTHFPIVVLRAGAYVSNAIKVNADGTVILKTQAQQNDILCFDNVAFLVNSYN